MFTAIALMSCSNQEIEQYVDGIKHQRATKLHEFLDGNKSPLGEENLSNAEPLKYFPIDVNWRLQGQLNLLNSFQTMVLPKSKDSSDKMLKWATVQFEYADNKHQLSVFRPIKDALDTAFEDYLFIPFYDQTNGETTYANGRYLYPEQIDERTLLLDFNTVSNPYCAYADKWNCTMPPPENVLNIKVQAGEKKYRDHTAEK